MSKHHLGVVFHERCAVCFAFLEIGVIVGSHERTGRNTNEAPSFQAADETRELRVIIVNGKNFFGELLLVGDEEVSAAVKPMNTMISFRIRDNSVKKAGKIDFVTFGAVLLLCRYIVVFVAIFFPAIAGVIFIDSSCEIILSGCSV